MEKNEIYLLEVMAENSAQAQRLMDVDLEKNIERAVAVCRACSKARKEYISKYEGKIAETLQALADASKEKIGRAGINSLACIDLREYTKSLIKKERIEIKYASR